MYKNPYAELCKAVEELSAKYGYVVNINWEYEPNPNVVDTRLSFLYVDFDSSEYLQDNEYNCIMEDLKQQMSFNYVRYVMKFKQIPDLVYRCDCSDYCTDFYYVIKYSDRSQEELEKWCDSYNGDIGNYELELAEFMQYKIVVTHGTKQYEAEPCSDNSINLEGLDFVNDDNLYYKVAEAYYDVCCYAYEQCVLEVHCIIVDGKVYVFDNQ